MLLVVCQSQPTVTTILFNFQSQIFRDQIQLMYPGVKVLCEVYCQSA